MNKSKVIGKSGYEYVSSYDEIVNHTIERCAQVAEDYFAGRIGERNGGVVAAILKLKDRP